MEINEFKKTILELIKKLDQSDPMVEYLKAFIQTYDGTNITELVTFLLPVIGMINTFEEHKIKSEGYDEILEVTKQQKIEENLIKEKFKDIQAGKYKDETLISEE